MIEDIKNINIPDYAEFKDASAQLQDMGEKTITANVEIAGGVVPDFSSDWEVEFQGERYIMPLRSPQGSRDNTKLSSSLSLTFQHWAIYQLKRYYFVTLQPIESGTAIADKYEASVNLNLHDFCDLFGQVLKHYYGNAIKVDLNPSWAYDSEPATVEISHSYIWDVLAEVYNLYGVRWQITGSGHAYTIKFGYPTNEVAHIFEQGFSGGLLKVERQVQNDNIRNKIIGRGGNENLPYRYFKQKDENNDTFSPDPDWIPELANIYFDKLRGATFRSYVQGWKQKHYGGASVTSADNAYAPWAWQKGYTDAKFDPVEYVKDDESIARYGELYGGYDNDDIKPTIQGITIDPIGRVDEVVDVEKVLTDDYEKTQEAGTVLTNIGSMKGTMQLVRHQKDTILSNIIEFSVQEGKTANIERGPYTYEAHGTDSKFKTIDLTEFIVVYGVEVSVIKKTDGKAVSSVGIPPGDYRLQLKFSVENTHDVYSAQTTVCCDNVNIVDGNVNPKFQSTWDIWVKNIWQTSQNEGETDAQYAERVWRPILGDKEKNEAKVVFSDGMLAFSSDYEFVITSIPKKDDSKTRNGVQSEWRITLGKSDADLETLGVYQPSVERFAEAGDHFFFTGIDMPHLYVVWAEERLDDFKGDQLNEVKDIKPSWLVSPDKVRIGEAGAAAYGETETLLSQLHIGDTFRLADQVFIKDAAYETLYLQSITYNYKGTLNPDVEIVLSNDYAVSANPVEELQGEVSALNRQVGSLSNIEQVVRAVGDKLYLRKDGIGDRSVSPTEFLSRIMGGNFRAGIVGGTGWGFYQDDNGDWVLETDQVKVRHDMVVNNLVINQISAQGGMVIESAASMTVTGVVEYNNDYKLYFDTKNGTVPNLFKVGDVVMCQAFDNSNKRTKFYKRRVMQVSTDSISVYRSSYVNGTGVPEVGDVLVQYGSYADANRRYVKIRDVVGGGYERYISGLSTVNTEGAEYYFVGRMTGQYYNQGRFFLGTQGGKYIEYKNGDLNISGNIILGAGSSGLENLSEWQTKQTQIDNAAQEAQDAATAANAAQGTANAANTAANSAQTAASNAQTTANSAQSTANTANSTANSALNKANSAQTAADNLQYLAGIFPTGNIVAGGAVLAQFLGVLDNNNNVVAGINGSTSAITGTSIHGKLMIFAGATSLSNANNADTRIYSDGNLFCKNITANQGTIGPFYLSSEGFMLEKRYNNTIPQYGEWFHIKTNDIQLWNKSISNNSVYENKSFILNVKKDDYSSPLLEVSSCDVGRENIFGINKNLRGMFDLTMYNAQYFDVAINCRAGMFAGLRPNLTILNANSLSLTFSENVVIVDYNGNVTINLPNGSGQGTQKGYYVDIHGNFKGTKYSITIKTSYVYDKIQIAYKNQSAVSSYAISNSESVRIIYDGTGVFYLVYLWSA